VRMPSAEFRITHGSPKRYTAKADSGNEITRVFCGECGTPLYVQVSTRPDIVGVRVCTLDDASWFRPEANIFVKSAAVGPHGPGRADLRDLSHGKVVFMTVRLSVPRDPE
jgi:hypothetical protein